MTARVANGFLLFLVLPWMGCAPEELGDASAKFEAPDVPDEAMYANCYDAEVVNVPKGDWVAGFDLNTMWGGINENGVMYGQVVRHGRISGVIYDLNTDDHAFVDLPGKDWVDLGDINDLGTIAFGASWVDDVTGDRVMHAYTMDVTGHVDHLRNPKGSDAWVNANGLNNLGDAVGAYWDEYENRFRGVIWSGKDYVVYDAAPDVHTWLTDIADDGTVVGYASECMAGVFGSCEVWSFRDAFNGQAERIVRPGANYTVVQGLNNRGMVVGWSAQEPLRFVPDSSDVGTIDPMDTIEARAFVYHEGEWRPVRVPGYGTYALGINDRGTVVGTFDHAHWGFVAEPVRCGEL